MPQNDHTSLPESLDYLQAFADALGKLEPEDRDESVDSSPLEVTLRERFCELTVEEAEEELFRIRELLEHWLEDKPAHVGHWIFGYLSFPDIAEILKSPAAPVSNGPKILFEAPTGWDVAKAPFRLNLKSDEAFGSIGVTDELSFHVMPLQFEGAMKAQPPHVRATVEFFDVAYEQCTGKKYAYHMTAPALGYQVTYVLSVPGGYLHITLWTETGKPFDQQLIESKFHTLRVVPSA